MKEEKTKTKKKGLYYFLLIVSVLLLAAATVLTVYFTTNDQNDLAENPPVDQGGDDQDDDQNQEPEQPEEPDEPTGGETLYVAPIASEGYTVEYDAIYANKITGSYYRHQGVDFAAAAGTAVYAVADGTVTDVSLSEELGNLITIDHGDGLVSVYRFVEPVEGLEEGDTVSRGDQIASVAEAYGSEAGDGTHLHFEMKLNGAQTDPAQYLDPVYEEK
ncbi:MAG TPA: M23 family metallopeptidase [Firmicutes bacterium]|nr:M23 family metallopeptidase [Bacillota bacterium]